MPSALGVEGRLNCRHNNLFAELSFHFEFIVIVSISENHFL